MSIKNKAVSGVKWSTIGTLGRAVFQLVQISILTRFLPKEAFGLIAMALFLVQFSTIFVDMGMTSAILHKQNVTKTEYSSAYWLNIFIALGLYGLLFLCTPVAARFYEEPELTTLIPILGLNLLFMAMGRQHYTLMQKDFNFRAIALVELISFFIGLISSVVFAVMGYGVYSLVYSTLIASLISNTLFLIMNKRDHPILFHFKFRETKDFLRIGGFTMGSTLLDFFSREIDVLIIGKLLGAESLGIYSLAKQIVIKLFSIINPVVLSVLNPLLASMQSEKARLKASYLKVINYLAYINFPVYILVIVASKEILILLYGPEYADSYAVLSFLAFAYCLAALSNPVSSLQIATGRTDIGFKWTIVRLSITPIFLYLGALHSIETVAALYALLSLLFIIPMWYMQLRTMAQISLREYINQFYKPLLFFLSATVFIYLAGDQLYIFENSFLNLLFKCIIFVVLYGIYLILVDRKAVMESYQMVYGLIKFKK